MRKNILFLGLGVIVASLFAFFFRLIDATFFQDRLTNLIFFGVIGLALTIWGFFGKKKSLNFFGLGILGTAVLQFALRWINFSDNLIMFIVFLIFGIIIVLYGVLKR